MPPQTACRSRCETTSSVSVLYNVLSRFLQSIRVAVAYSVSCALLKLLSTPREQVWHLARLSRCMWMRAHAASSLAKIWSAERRRAPAAQASGERSVLAELWPEAFCLTRARL